jgi:redox-sensitive bicupin YhaK (pirin superfamily)
MRGELCAVARVVHGAAVVDGAGVRLHRLIGSPRLDHVDPFVLFDEFRSDNPNDYIAGFPDHPHRGIETITYMVQGSFRHRDSRGGGGVLGPGSVQWMTAGRGIIHSEMPEMRQGRLWGYQLWLNLAAKDKMVPPRYQQLDPEQIPVVSADGLTVRLIAGAYGGRTGPAQTYYPVSYFDVHVCGEGEFLGERLEGDSALLYVHSGRAQLQEPGGPRALEAGELALLGPGRRVQVTAADPAEAHAEAQAEAGFLYLSGMPHREPIARGGPFVMNTPEEIHQAFLDYQNGSLF